MIRHQFTSAKTDAADATLVRPGNWNADHFGVFAPGTITIPTGNFAIAVDRVELTGSQVVTLQGDAILKIL